MTRSLLLSTESWDHHVLVLVVVVAVFCGQITINMPNSKMSRLISRLPYRETGNYKENVKPPSNRMAARNTVGARVLNFHFLLLITAANGYGSIMTSYYSVLSS
jgi:hypothetical protein